MDFQISPLKLPVTSCISRFKHERIVHLSLIPVNSFVLFSNVRKVIIWFHNREGCVYCAVRTEFIYTV